MYIIDLKWSMKFLTQKSSWCKIDILDDSRQGWKGIAISALARHVYVPFPTLTNVVKRWFYDMTQIVMTQIVS